MEGSLEGMPLEELWQLFPIALRDHDPQWAVWYAREAEAVVAAVGEAHVFRIQHIGSTSVPGLLAKPTVDILLELAEGTPQERLVDRLTAAGYIYDPKLENALPRMVFMKGYTPKGFEERVFHLHARCMGDWDELYFRDYLRLHPEAVREYAALKQDLFRRFEHNRDGYTDAKSDFIRRYTALARRELKDRYRPST